MVRVVVTNKTKDELSFEVYDEDHTLLNLMQKALLKRKNTELAEYTVPHRLLSKAVFCLKTDGVDSVQSLLDASREIKGESEEFKKALDRALKEYSQKKQ